MPTAHRVPTDRVQACDFAGLRIEYDERVLTPRPWTVLQSDWAAEIAASAGPGPLLELCAGAGHIGLAAALAAHRDLVQVEADPVAAGYADANAREAGWSARQDLRVRRLESALRPGEMFPLVLADPPYLPTAQVQRWPEDPVTAIDGGTDGLDVVRAILQVVAAHTAAGTSLLLQVAGAAQADAVAELAEQGPDAAYRRGEVRSVDDERAVLQLVRRR